MSEKIGSGVHQLEKESQSNEIKRHSHSSNLTGRIDAISLVVRRLTELNYQLNYESVTPQTPETNHLNT